MRKSIVGFIVFLICLITMETVLYFKDYSEMMNVVRYIEHDINNGVIDSILTDKYEVLIHVGDDSGVTYTLIAKRKGIFDIKKLKTIKYHGIVS